MNTHPAAPHLAAAEQQLQQEEELKDRLPIPVVSTIASAVIEVFKSLPKKGKPQLHEYTVLAGIAVTLPPSSCSSIDQTVICVATGTKCLPGAHRAEDGSAVNDCHAEVLCRRALVRWLIQEGKLAVQKEGSSRVLDVVAANSTASDTAEKKSGVNTPVVFQSPVKLALKQGVKFHMFVSQPPCGDASIIHLAEDGCGDVNNSKSNHNRTGAKPLFIPHQRQPQLDGGGDDGAPMATLLPTAADVETYTQPQQTGLARRKPGKGEPTLSMSCSDKIAKWQLLGLQGALMTGVLSESVMLSSLTVGYCSEDTRAAQQVGQALQRAVVDRVAPLQLRLLQDAASSQQQQQPCIDLHACIIDSIELAELGLAPSPTRRTACGSTIVWQAPPTHYWNRPKKTLPGGWSLLSTSIDLNGTVHEALVGGNGCKMGVGRKGAASAPLNGRSMFCKVCMMQEFVQLLHIMADMCATRSSGSSSSSNGGQKRDHTGALIQPTQQQPFQNSKNIAVAGLTRAATYKQLKELVGRQYLENWKMIQAPPSLFEIWIHNPHRLEQFTATADVVHIDGSL